MVIFGGTGTLFKRRKFDAAISFLWILSVCIVLYGAAFESCCPAATLGMLMHDEWTLECTMAKILFIYSC